MHDWVPKQLKLSDEVSPASWVEERLWPWESGGVLVGSYMPDVFEAYARVFHPAYRDDGSEVRWSDLARERGINLRGDTSFREVGGSLVADNEPGPVGAPPEGDIPPDVLLALARILDAHTSTPNRCWFCFWEGDGTFWSEAHGWLRRDNAPEPEEIMERARRQDQIWEAAPRLRAPGGRNYLIFSGPLSVLEDLTGSGVPELNLWWPDDRSWLVSTEVDAITSYVGGTQEVIDAVLADHSFDAVEVRVDSRLDPRR